MHNIQEYSVRVSFLELYNEELFDLLSTGVDNSRLRIFEDSSKKVQFVISSLVPSPHTQLRLVMQYMEGGNETIAKLAV